MAERVQILIDGSNFYHLVLKKLNLQQSDFLFDEFVNFLAAQGIITKFGKRYYTGTIREIEGNVKSKEAMAKQVKFMAQLKNSDWEIRTSKLRAREENIVIDDRVENYQEILKKGVKEIRIFTQREKGIDVKIATDIICGAVDSQYDKAIIVSSDTDLIPAVDWVRSKYKKKVEYIGFSIEDQRVHAQRKENTVPTLTFIRKTDCQRILTTSDLARFIRKQEQLL